MDLAPHIQKIRDRFKSLEDTLSEPDIYNDPRKANEVTREHSRMKQSVQDAEALEKTERQLRENQELAKGADAEMAALALEEIPALEKETERLRTRVLDAIVPHDPAESRDTIIEIRAGAGGDEAAIFAGDLLRMYLRYAERTGWKTEILDASPAEFAGYKEVVFTVTGTNVFQKMRFESGVHRVQRVPATEAQGRIHTSTATVAVLPKAEEVDVVIKPEDLEINVKRAGGHGGQGVNTTDSAVQIIHKPTGLIVVCQDARSQIKNRASAMSVLRARLYERKKNEEDAKYAAHRRSQVGTGERNEKMRTYNYPQNRITDHRINFTVYSLELFMDGDIEEMFEMLLKNELQEKLHALLQEPEQK